MSRRTRTVGGLRAAGNLLAGKGFRPIGSTPGLGRHAGRVKAVASRGFPRAQHAAAVGRSRARGMRRPDRWTGVLRFPGAVVFVAAVEGVGRWRSAAGPGDVAEKALVVARSDPPPWPRAICSRAQAHPGRLPAAPRSLLARHHASAASSAGASGSRAARSRSGSESDTTTRLLPARASVADRSHCSSATRTAAATLAASTRAA